MKTADDVMEIKTTAEIVSITFSSNSKEWANKKWVSWNDVKSKLKV